MTQAVLTREEVIKRVVAARNNLEQEIAAILVERRQKIDNYVKLSWWERVLNHSGPIPVGSAENLIIEQLDEQQETLSLLEKLVRETLAQNVELSWEHYKLIEKWKKLRVWA